MQASPEQKQAIRAKLNELFSGKRIVDVDVETVNDDLTVDAIRLTFEDRTTYEIAIVEDGPVLSLTRETRRREHVL